MPFKNPERKREYAREYYNRTRKKRCEYSRKYRKEHIERIREISRKYANSPKGREKIKAWKEANQDLVRSCARKHQSEIREKLIALWGKIARKLSQKELDLIEELGCKLLKLEGYEPLRVSQHFPFDCLAKKDKRIYAVDFTICYKKVIREHQRKLAGFLGWQIIICFIKSDFSTYRTIEVPNHLTGINILNKIHQPINFKEIPEKLKLYLRFDKPALVGNKMLKEGLFK